MWGTRPEAPPDPKVNTAICLDELLHLPMFHQTYWWTCIFFGRHNWPLNFVRWVLPSLQYRRREKTFFNKKINFKIGSGSLLRGLSSLQHCRWCRRLAFPSGDYQVGAYGIDALSEATGTGSVESTGEWDFEPLINRPNVYYLMLGLMNRRLSPLKAAAKGCVAGIDDCFAPENRGPFRAAGGNECECHHLKEFCFPTARNGGEK